MKKVTWFVFFSIIAVSCLNEPDCFQLNNNIIVLNFKILGGESDAFVIVDGITSPGTDSAFYAGTSNSQIELPLNPMQDATEFVFDGAYGINGLQLSYDRQVEFVSSDCGERYTFSNLKIEGHNFDSIRTVNTTPTRPASSNYDVYRCPRTDLMGVQFSEAATVVVDSVSADHLGLIYVIKDTVQSISLPVNTLASTTTFTFKLGNGTARKLTVNYVVTPRTLYTLCGQQRFIGGLSATSDFTTTTLTSDSINDLPIINFEITP